MLHTLFRKKQKVFCVGFHKTGTKSMKVALSRLGYRVTGPNGVTDPDISTNADAMIDSLVRKFDAFQDNPWPLFYRELDSRYPDSKFILTLRDSESWIRSQVNHFGYLETPMREWIYGVGCPAGNEHVYIRRYEQHNRSVLDYFVSRSNTLLTMNLQNGDGWKLLCNFLNVPCPEGEFPHSNKADTRRKKRPGKAVQNRIG